MTTIGQNSSMRGLPIPHLRWWICGLLFASTVINYIDRQTFSVLGPYFKQDFSDARQTAVGHSFDPIVIVAGFVPFFAMVLVLLLVRNTQATEEGLVRRI